MSDEVCALQHKCCLGMLHMQSVFVFTARIMGLKVFLFVYDNQGVFVSVCVGICKMLRHADAAH